MNSVRFDFTDARIAVTGGTSGIGLEVAARFAQAGAIVTVTGRRTAASDYDGSLTPLITCSANSLIPLAVGCRDALAASTLTGGAQW